MAKGIHPNSQANLKKFQPGNSGNPGGKYKLYLTKEKVSKVLSDFSSYSVKKLKGVIENEDSNVLEVMIASIMVKAIEQGDHGRLESLLNRSIGKVKEELEQTIKNIDDSELDAIPRNVLLKLAAGENP